MSTNRILPPDDVVDQWTVTEDLRSPGSGFNESNYDYEELVQGELPSEVVARIEFDSEDAQFFCYTASEADARAVDEAVSRVVASRSEKPENQKT